MERSNDRFQPSAGKRSFWSVWRIPVLAFLLPILVAVGIISQTGDRIIGLAWSPVAHDNPIRYEVGYGTSSLEYTTIKEVSAGEDYTLAGLDCVVYFVAVRACDTVTVECGAWSDNEIRGYPSRAGKLCSVPGQVILHDRTDL